MTDERRESIKESNSLIDAVIDDGKGSLLFCHEAKDITYREIAADKEVI